MSDTLTVRVGPKGRVVIPAVTRKALGIEEGDELVAVLEDDGVLLIDRAKLLRRVQDRFAQVSESLSEQLIAERRAEDVRDRA